jgi:hypothetical protein
VHDAQISNSPNVLYSKLDNDDTQISNSPNVLYSKLDNDDTQISDSPNVLYSKLDNDDTYLIFKETLDVFIRVLCFQMKKKTNSWLLSRQY